MHGGAGTWPRTEAYTRELHDQRARKGCPITNNDACPAGNTGCAITRCPIRAAQTSMMEPCAIREPHCMTNLLLYPLGTLRDPRRSPRADIHAFVLFVMASGERSLPFCIEFPRVNCQTMFDVTPNVIRDSPASPPRKRIEQTARRIVRCVDGLAIVRQEYLIRRIIFN
jgi:hypothetical protein